ncbi:MAG: helix-turn-helix domain-containing protein [Nostoc sp. JL33]|nr:helix-turn-helix domain-containing protein [Nostoc sp. JL33]MBN3870367.1 helix-turn-helix domain-containing protein [Nostoc sp. JL33]
MVGGLEYALEDRPHPPKPRKLDGKQEAFLVATACSTAPFMTNSLDNAAFSRAVGKSWYR